MNSDQKKLEEIYSGQILEESVRSRLANVWHRAKQPFAKSSDQEQRDTPAVAEAKKVWGWFRKSLTSEIDNLRKELSEMTDKGYDQAQAERVQIKALEQAKKFFEDPNGFYETSSGSSISGGGASGEYRGAATAQTGGTTNEGIILENVGDSSLIPLNKASQEDIKTNKTSSGEISAFWNNKPVKLLNRKIRIKNKFYRKTVDGTMGAVKDKDGNQYIPENELFIKKQGSASTEASAQTSTTPSKPNRDQEIVDLLKLANPSLEFNEQTRPYIEKLRKNPDALIKQISTILGIDLGVREKSTGSFKRSGVTEGLLLEASVADILNKLGITDDLIKAKKDEITKKVKAMYNLSGKSTTAAPSSSAPPQTATTTPPPSQTAATPPQTSSTTTTPPPPQTQMNPYNSENDHREIQNRGARPLEIAIKKRFDRLHKVIRKFKDEYMGRFAKLSDRYGATRGDYQQFKTIEANFNKLMDIIQTEQTGLVGHLQGQPQLKSYKFL